MSVFSERYEEPMFGNMTDKEVVACKILLQCNIM